MYTRTKRCYNERGSRTNYVRSSISHCTSEEEKTTWKTEKKGAQYYFDLPPSNAALQRGITLAPITLSVPA